MKSKAAPEISSQSQIGVNAPQGWMTNWFQDYYLRKVSGDFYEILREGIPIIDAAIRRLISLNGTIKVIGDNEALVRELEDFCLNVPVNDKQKGVHAFLENASNETFEQGFAIAEFVATKDMKDIAGLRVADSKHIVFRRDKDGKAEAWYRYPGNLPTRTYSRPESVVEQILTATYNQAVWINGLWEEKLSPGNKLYFSINNENSDPSGVSIMRSMEFVSKILMTMQNSLANVWERFGDPIYHVKYKTTKRDIGGDDVEKRRQKLQTDFQSAINSKRSGKSADLVTAINADADIIIEIVGHDNQILEVGVPSRHVLEQIVSKTNLPAWMLGLYWSTTERMATLEVESALQDAKIRQLAMLPEFIRLFSIYLKLRGLKWKTITTDIEKPGDWGIIFETPNLRDLVSQAQARFLNAQADMMQSGALLNLRTGVNNPQSDINIEEASVEINGMKFPVSSPLIPFRRGTNTCRCVKELSRPMPWPELDEVETEYEERLKEDWQGMQERVLEILKLSNIDDQASGHEHGQTSLSVPSKMKVFGFSDEQRKAIMDALKKYLGDYDWNDADSPVRWSYGQAYSLGLIQAAKLLGKERPILDIIANKEVFNEIAKNGFKLVRDNATTAIVDEIIPAIEEQIGEGVNPKDVARKLGKMFGDKNSDWERLARSEMSMAAENAKIDEWEAWGVKKARFAPAPDACPICMALAGDYDIGDVPVPVEATHPRCRCSISVSVSEYV